MPLQCESAVGCVNLAAVAVSVLAPTGETITDDTGTAPVLRSVLEARLCLVCAAGAYPDAMFGRAIAALGGHVDREELSADDVLDLDGISLAKAAAERELYEVETHAHEARRQIREGIVTSRVVLVPSGIRTWAR